MLERVPVAAPGLDHSATQAGPQSTVELARLEIRLTLLPSLEVAGEARLLRTVKRRPRRHRL
jgi:hypothetical protein